MRVMMDSTQASAYVGLARQTLARMRCEPGGIPFTKAGKKVLYEQADLDAWLDSRRCRSTADTVRRPAWPNDA